MVGKFLIENSDAQISDQCIKDILAQSHGRSIDDYLKDVILKQGEDARDIVLILAPIVLRISVNIVIFDYSKITVKVFCDKLRIYPSNCIMHKLIH